MPWLACDRDRRVVTYPVKQCGRPGPIEFKGWRKLHQYDAKLFSEPDDFLEKLRQVRFFEMQSLRVANGLRKLDREAELLRGRTRPSRVRLRLMRPIE